jgi:uncharacterized membrane-anchored protein
MKQLMVFSGTRKLAMGATVLLFILMLIPSIALAAPIGSTYTVKVDTGYLALRTAPAYDYSNEIGQLYTGEKVSVINKGGTYWWVYSSKYDREGYVNSNYLTNGSNPSPDYGTYKVKVATGYLALRTAPAYDYSNEIGQLYTGDTVTVKEKGGTYWWVYSSKYGREGYVNSNYLTTGSTPSDYGDYSVKVATSYLALRTAPAFEYANEVGKLYTGDTVTVKEKGGTYWWVYSPKYGREGYVNSNFLVKK